MEIEWQERTLLQIGIEGVKDLSESSVAVIGLGGVGAYAAEMLCRAGVGNLLIADSDRYNPTNKNRQLGALDSTMGLKKTQVMSQRLRDINKEVKISVVEEYITSENVEELLNYKIDFLVDAIDTLSPKISLIKFCVENKIPLVSSMGAGAKFDATKIRLSDIKKSHSCPLAYKLRKSLRKVGISTGFDVVYSEELPMREAIVPFEERNKKSRTGTISYLPAVFGCVCAQAAICHIIKKC